MKLTYLIVGLTLFGLLMVGNASVVSASRDFGDKWYFLKHQALWAAVGLGGFLAATRLDHRRLDKYAITFFVVSVCLLVGVFIPPLGVHVLGARRWLNLGFTSFQPSEIAKLALAVYLGSLFKHRPKFIQFAAPLGLLS